MTTLVNGELTESISTLDRGLAYGDGLFETCSVRAGRPLLWSEHLQRLFLGCSRLNIPSPDLNQLRSEIDQLCQNRDGVLKIILTRGVGQRGYASVSCQPTRMISFTQQSRTESSELERVTLRLCQSCLSINPILAGIKHLNRLEQVLARAEWEDAQIDEGIMLSALGDVVEGVSSNFFLVKNGCLLTPDLTQCGVAGVMRQKLLQEAEVLGLECCIKRLMLEDLQQADELLICNSVEGVRSVMQFEGFVWPQVGPLTQRLWQRMKLYW